MACKATAFVTAATLLTAAAPVYAPRVVVGVAPPVALVEPIPAPPVAGYVWRPGYWAWNGVRYVWVPGVYVAPARVGASWVPGHWVAGAGGWVWVGGHWR
jgi:hypothetical protein